MRDRKPLAAEMVSGSMTIPAASNSTPSAERRDRVKFLKNHEHVPISRIEGGAKILPLCRERHVFAARVRV